VGTVKKSEGEELFAMHCKAMKAPEPKREYPFAHPRRWRFDFAWPSLMLALEVEGGIWTKGRHSRGSGMEADMEKYNHAARLGWRVLRYSTGMVESGQAISEVLEILKGETRAA